jgi:hypothetical protein
LKGCRGMSLWWGSDQDLPRSLWLLPPSKEESQRSLLGGPFATNQLVIFSGELKLEIVQVWFSIAAMIAQDFKRMRFGNVACVPWMALNLIRRSPRHIDSPSVGLRPGSVRSEACIGECDSSGVLFGRQVAGRIRHGG